MARPTKLTPETQNAIIKALRIGATRKTAAEAAGVDYRTFLNWLERGDEAQKGIYFQFFQSVSVAESEAFLKYTSIIAKAAQGGEWRAALEFLKRRDREHWGDNADYTSGGKTINQIIVSGIDPDKL